MENCLESFPYLICPPILPPPYLPLSKHVSPLFFGGRIQYQPFLSLSFHLVFMGVSCFIWLISPGLCRAKLWIVSSLGKPCREIRLGNFGYFAFMVSFGRFWLERNRLIFENSSGDASVVWDSFWFSIASWSKVVFPFPFFPFELSLYLQLGFLMRMIFNFINIFFLLPIKKNYLPCKHFATDCLKFCRPPTLLPSRI